MKKPSQWTHRTACILIMLACMLPLNISALSTGRLVIYTSMALASLVACRYVHIQIVHLKQIEAKNSTHTQDLGLTLEKMNVALGWLAHAYQTLKTEIIKLKHELQVLKQTKKEGPYDQIGMEEVAEPSTVPEQIIQTFAYEQPSVKTSADEQIDALKRRIAQLEHALAQFVIGPEWQKLV